MKHDDDLTRRTPRGGGEQESVGSLTRRLISEARERAEADRRAAVSRGPLTRVLLALTLVAVAACVATGAYGAYNFPDAPIRPKAGGYAGKTGRPRTQAEYETYLNWTLAMWTVFPAVFVAGAAFAYSDARDRRRGRRVTQAGRDGLPN